MGIQHSGEHQRKRRRELRTRLGFAGLKFADCGSLDYGRNYGVVYDIESGPICCRNSAAIPTQTDVYMTGRTNGVATYRNSDFFGLVDGLHFALQYQGNNENAGSGEGTNNGGKRKLARENGDGFGISSYYDLDMGISFGAAYSSSDRTHNQLAAARSQRYANGDKADARPSARNMTPITSIWPPCMLRPAT